MESCQIKNEIVPNSSNWYSFVFIFLGMKKKSMKSTGEDSGAG